VKTRILIWAVFLAVPAATGLASWSSPSRATGAALGRQVYIAEGCIHCHSQYVRPGTADAERWGNARDPEFSRVQSPALIGNRRQGPDLMNAGLRLPRDWHRAHLRNPRSVSPASRMPAYPHLFAAGDPRGEALLDYLESLGREDGSAPNPNLPP
jgi:cbb3-type cytochrome oxidase cytochrome c subunit